MSQMNIPLAKSPESMDCQERADCAERMLDATTRHDMKEMWKVLDSIGDAENKRGQQMIQYVNLAKDFYKEMKDL